MPAHDYELRPIGRVESPLRERNDAPNQGDEGSPDARLVFDPTVLPGLRELESGTDVLLFTWFDRAHRDLANGPRVQVANLEALDGTPILDVKPLLEPIGER